MNGDSWNIRKAEGGFIVDVNKQTSQPSDNVAAGGFTYHPYVFADSSALINFLHNELAGSN